MLKNKIIFITDKWGSAKGGINSFNTDFCKALAEIVSEDYEVVCTVEKATEQDEKDAGKVKLISYNQGLHENCAVVVNSKIKEGNDQKHLWVGHDYISGHIANEAKKLNYGKSVVFQHMAPWLYQSEKCGDGNKALGLYTVQSKIAEECDYIFSIGPLLSEYSSRFTNNKNKITELIPGIHVQNRTDYNSRNFFGITFGRLDKDSDIIKQGSLAAKAFFSATKGIFSEDSAVNLEFTLVGLSKEDKEYENEFTVLKEECDNLKGKNVILNGLSFLEGKERLNAILRSQNLCMMLSKHEGFGLVGWEAIGAAIPLIVSKESGIYTLIRDSHRELLAYLYPVNVSKGDEDIGEVIEKIKIINEDKKKAFEYADKLREGLKHYTWEKAARVFWEKAERLVEKKCEIPTKTEQSVKVPPPFQEQDIDKKIENELKKLFENKKNRQLTEAIYEVLAEKDKTGENSDKATKLTKYLLDCPSHSQVLVMLHKALKKCYEVATDEKKELFKCAQDIFGWLIIRHVDHQWIAKNSASIFDSKKSAAIELPVSTHVGAEILTRRVEGEKAGFVKPSGDTIMGEHSLIKHKIAVREFGWLDEDKISSFKKMLWKLVFKEEFAAGIMFGHEQNEKLNGKLKYMFQTETYYFPINFKDDDAKLISIIKDELCYSKLKGDLPDFRVVIINIGGKESPLLIKDTELEGELLGFFELEPK